MRLPYYHTTKKILIHFKDEEEEASLWDVRGGTREEVTFVAWMLVSLLVDAATG